jgi:hypothetical protein
MHEQVASILWDWDGLRVADAGAYWVVAGSYAGVSHAGTRADPVSLAHDLKALAGSGTRPEPAPVVEPEPAPAPAVEAAPEPLPEVMTVEDLQAMIRDIVRDMVEPDPEPAPAPEPAPEPEPEATVVPEALAPLVLPDEAPEVTRARLAGRWVELTHLLQMGLATGEQAAEHTLLSAHQEWLTS